MEGPAAYQKEAYKDEKREDFRERNFPRVIAQHIIEHAADDLSEAGFDDGEIREFEEELAALDEEGIRAFLSLPSELRPKMYRTYADKVHNDQMSVKDVVKDLREKNERNHFTLGYHLSPREIKPGEDGSWTILGTEPDHRNDDIPMAYYSTDYRNRYREKPSRYLYVIRAELRNESGHYQDTNGVWGRAPSLSVIDRFDLPAIEREIDQLMKKMEEGNENGEMLS